MRYSLDHLGVLDVPETRRKQVCSTGDQIVQRVVGVFVENNCGVATICGAGFLLLVVDQLVVNGGSITSKKDV